MNPASHVSRSFLFTKRWHMRLPEAQGWPRSNIPLFCFAWSHLQFPVVSTIAIVRPTFRAGVSLGTCAGPSLPALSPCSCAGSSIGMNSSCLCEGAEQRVQVVWRSLAALGRLRTETTYLSRGELGRRNQSRQGVKLRAACTEKGLPLGP